MPPTSTVTSRRVRKHPLFRYGPPVLAALMAIPLAAFVVTLGGSSGEDDVTLAPVAETKELLVAPVPDRASRSATRVEEAPSSSTTTTLALVEVTQVTEERVIPAGKELRDDPALPRGETRVEADGSPGLERVVFEVTRTNGRITAKRKISSEVVTPAQPRVVYVGRGGGRNAPADGEVPLKLRIAASETPPSAGGGRQQEGGASWYRYKPGTCAHRSIAKGTVVTVTNLGNGKTITCTVADRGPFIAGRIIDLERGVFMAIADSPGQGVMRVRIEW
jgi:hypothetical protein